MKVDIKKVARIARLYLTPQEEEKYTSNLQIILPWFNEMLSLKNLPNVDISPVYTTVTEDENRNSFQDEISREESTDDILRNTPNKKGNLIFVPKVI